MQPDTAAWLDNYDGRWLVATGPSGGGTLIRPLKQPGRAPLLLDDRRRAVDLDLCDVRTLEHDEDQLVLEVDGIRLTLRAPGDDGRRDVDHVDLR
jgi:hypothetical protein